MELNHFTKSHTNIYQPLMLHKAESHCSLHIIEGTERKKCFINEQNHCFQLNIGHQYSHSY